MESLVPKTTPQYSVANATPVESKEDAQIVFSQAAPRLAHRLLEIAEKRLNFAAAQIPSTGDPKQDAMNHEVAMELETATQDSGIEILNKFKKQLFSERPTMHVNVNAKVGGISEEAKAILDRKRGESREVVVEGTVVGRGNS